MNNLMFSNADLKKLIIPLLIEQILAVTIGMADVIMVAGSGEAAVSGIALVDSVNILLTQVFAALATGGAVVAAQYLGKQEKDNACIAAKQLYYSVLAISVFLAAIAVCFRSPILYGIFGSVEDSVMENAKVYFLFTALSYPFLAAYNSGAALFRSMGNSKISMTTSIIMNISNLTGNAILIMVFNMGVLGAAISTLIARIIGSVIMTVLIQDKNNSIHIEGLLKIKLKWDMIKRIMSVGIPTGLENGMFQIGKLLVQRLVASFGTVAIAANAVAGNVASFEVIPGAAIGLSIITVIGQCVGAGAFEQARMYVKKLMKFTFISQLILNIIILLCLDPISQLYNLSPETAELAKLLMAYHGILCIIIWPLSFSLPNVLRAAGDAKFTMFISVSSMWIFRICCSYLFALTFGLGVFGIWVAMTVDWCFRSLCFSIRFKRDSWTKKRLV